MSYEMARIVIGAGLTGLVLGVLLCANAVLLLNEHIESQKDHIRLMDYRAACWKARCEELKYVSFLLERGIIKPPLVSRDGSPCTFTTIDDLTK